MSRNIAGELSPAPSPRDLENKTPKALSPATRDQQEIRFRSPRQQTSSSQTAGNVKTTAPEPESPKPQKNYFFRGLVLFILAGVGAGIYAFSSGLILKQKTAASYVQPATVQGGTWTPAPYLSTQNFSFASTLDFQNINSTQFVEQLCAAVNFTTDVIVSVENSTIQDFNATGQQVTILKLTFLAYYSGSNDFRDAIKAQLSSGFLSSYQIVGFGEGLQTPLNFCPSGTYGPSCLKCTSCTGELKCDSGALGTGGCICPTIFVNGSLYNQFSGTGISKRCLRISSINLNAGSLAAEFSETTVRNITITNIGSTSESVSGAVTSADDEFTIAVNDFFKVAAPIKWPVVLSPGASLTVSVKFCPTDGGKFSGKLFIFVDNDPLTWTDDVTMAIPINVTGTIAGQIPVNGRVAGTFAIYRIDVGSSESTTYEENTFVADSWFTTSSSMTSNGALQTIHPMLKTYRTFSPITNSLVARAHYTIPLQYTGDVYLVFYFADFQSTSSGVRTFYIEVNGVRTSSSPLDVFVLAGRSQSALAKHVYNMPSSSNTEINIYFVSNGGTPILNGLEVFQTLNVSVDSYKAGLSGDSINYAEALHKNYLFFHTMWSGKFNTRRLAWRGDSCLTCLGPKGQDLTGGFYEAGGNYLKVNFPMAWTLTNVGWGLVEHKQGHIKSKQLEYALEILKWGLDYFINCRLDDSTFAISMGRAFNYDFSYNGPPELYTQYVSQRPFWYAGKNSPFRSSETLAEVAAALAAGSIVWKDIDSSYSAKLLSEAKIHFDFAKSYPGSYMAGQSAGNTGYFELAALYPSTSYVDELAWGAAWIYRASGESTYLTDARTFYDANQASNGNGCGWAYSWDEKAPALHVLMGHIDQTDIARSAYYDTRASEYFNRFLPGEYRTVPHTPRGMAFISEWGSTRYAANTGYIAMIHSKYLEKRLASTAAYRDSLYEYGKAQIDYILGKTGRSMMAGMGLISPKYLQHKSSYNSFIYFPYRGISLSEAQREYYSNAYPQIHIAYGAVVGGPLKVNGVPTDLFADNRGLYQYTEPGFDYNGPLSAGIAALAEENDVTPISDSDLDLGWNFVAPRP